MTRTVSESLELEVDDCESHEVSDGCVPTEADDCGLKGDCDGSGESDG